MISYLIPSIRPNYLEVIIKQLQQYTKKDFEILVYSPHECEFENTIYYKETTSRGIIYAFNFLFQKSRGDVVYCLTDDLRIDSSIENGYNLLTSNQYKHKQFQVTGLSLSNTCKIPNFGDLCGSVQKLTRQLPTVDTLRFPIISRQTIIQELGGFIFHPHFYSWAGDIFLGYYCKKQGEECFENSGSFARTIQNPEKENYFRYMNMIRDCNTCLSLIENYENGYTDYVYNYPTLDYYDTQL